MIPKLPIYAKGDSMGIAVYPTGVSLEEVEIDMLVYTTGNGPRIYGSTQGSGLPIVKGTDRAVFNIPLRSHRSMVMREPNRNMQKDLSSQKTKLIRLLIVRIRLLNVQKNQPQTPTSRLRVRNLWPTTLRRSWMSGGSNTGLFGTMRPKAT